MSSKKLAKILSVILGPHVWTPLLFLLVLYKSNLTLPQSKIIFPTMLVLQVVIPIGYLLLAPKLEWVSQWDMKNKKERIPSFILMFFLTIISLIIIYLFGNKLLLHLNLTFLVLLVTLLVITIYWRISLHSSLNTAASIIVNFLFHWKAPLLYITIPIIMWARLKLSKHTVSQVVAGVIVTSLISLAGLALFGYL